MKLILSALAIALLSGCATIQQGVNYGRDANDSAVDASIFCLCHGCSIGSIRREFGPRPELWADLCLERDFIPTDDYRPAAGTGPAVADPAVAPTYTEDNPPPGRMYDFQDGVNPYQ